MSLVLLRRLIFSILFVAICSINLVPARAQAAPDAPLTSQELVRLVYQLPKNPGLRDEIVSEIRRRGIGFALTDGVRSVVATKSGNDALLRRTLEEAERRRQSPTAYALPAQAEANELLQRTRVVTLAASEAMPDFVVRQQITRAFAFGNTENWRTDDRITVAVSFRASAGEEYKLLAVNGLPPTNGVLEGNTYEQVGGASSTGEFVSRLANLFREETQASFKMVDTDVLRGRRTVVYEYEVKRENSRYLLKADKDNSVIVAYRGRVWIDREKERVLRLESTALNIPADFPAISSSNLVDYDWVTIAERPYLLPSRAEFKGAVRRPEHVIQFRNVILFRGYQKFGTEVKVIDDVEVAEDEPETKP
jgi:hypothetical protein